ncbi:trypsin alpha-3-like [Leptopilina heterotoma]|uniref:trypsin alpha-3-like n=1 Tax=Leptopilina heterotoma TaxID=63436 RepID=UPI001CA9E477|nr:trypsin alpha-3-like [Leptopilina heterotoma]
MIRFLTIAVLFISTSSAIANLFSSPQYRRNDIVAKIQDAPYVASLFINKKLKCGAVIITDSFLLTSADCLQFDDVTVYEIRTGSLSLNYGGTIHKVEYLLRHPKFQINNVKLPVDDIGLVKVRGTFLFDGTRDAIPIFPHKYLLTGSYGKIFGWGLTDSTYPIQLRTGPVTIDNVERCNDHFQGFLPNGQICAISTAPKVPCDRDSGGPLVVGIHLVGIISWGKECIVNNQPHAYTFVSFYREWIDESINNYMNRDKKLYGYRY